MINCNKIDSKIVWILNLSLDSFSGDSVFEDDLELCIEQMFDNGADIIDVWAESTAPWSKAITEDEEQNRLDEFISILNSWKFDNKLFSLDTTNASTAFQAMRLWIWCINDVSWWRKDPGMLKLIADYPSVKYVMMHSRNADWRAAFDNEISPFETDVSRSKWQSDILDTIFDFFEENLDKACKLWVKKDQIILDPWMWAFISSDHRDSVEVLRSLDRLKQKFGLPVFMWTSRKGFLSKLANTWWPEDRLWASLWTWIYAVMNWADFLRVHDVKETRRFIDSWNTLIK